MFALFRKDQLIALFVRNAHAEDCKAERECGMNAQEKADANYRIVEIEKSTVEADFHAVRNFTHQVERTAEYRYLKGKYRG